jgi:hypothetical protein
MRGMGFSPHTPGILCTESLTITCTRRQLALPSSQATPLDACPGLRPRWCPEHLPYRVQTYCLPNSLSRRLYFWLSKSYHRDHNHKFFGAQYRACILDPSGFELPLPGLPSDFTTDLLAMLWSGGTCATTARTHWVATTNFIPQPGFPEALDLARREGREFDF